MLCAFGAAVGTSTAIRLRGGIGRTHSSGRIKGVIVLSTMAWVRLKFLRRSSFPLMNHARVPRRLNGMRRTSSKSQSVTS